MDDDWGDISFGFNPADETINFKARAFGEDLNDLHEATTVAVVHSKTKENSNISIKSINKCGKSFLCVQNSIKVFENILCTDICYSGVFETNIRAISIADDGEHVFVYLETNICICIHIPNKTIVFQKSLNNFLDSGAFCIDIFISYDNGTNNIICIYNDGSIICLQNNENNEVEPTLMHKFNANIISACFNSGIIILLVGELEIFEYNIKHKRFSVHHKTENWIKIYPLDRTLYLGLNESGELCYLCAVTYLPFLIPDVNLLSDFMYVSDNSNSLIYASTLPDENNVVYLQLYKFPGMELLFNIKQQNSVILTIPANSTEDMMYIDRTEHDLSLKTVTETQAENRLLKILKRELFDEAESFAKQRNLDLEIVWKHHAQLYVNKLICSATEVEELLSMLVKINDVDFVVNSCLEATCNSFKYVQKVIFYAEERLQNDTSNKCCINSKMLLENVLHRLDTFNMLQKFYLPSDSMKEEEDEELLKRWNYFCDADLILHVNQLISRFELSKAALLFCRLDRKTKLEMDTSIIYMLLQGIPSEIDSENCVQFLKKFVPAALNLESECLPELVTWIQKKIYLIESMDTPNFPENALQFLNSLIPVFMQEISEVQHRTLEKLYEYRFCMEQLMTLKHEHSILITFDSMMQLPSLIAAVLIRERIDDGFQEFWLGFLFDYLVDNNLMPDQVLYSFIEEYMYENPFDWEDSIVTILKFVECVDTKMDASLMILENAEVPWNKSIENVAFEALKLMHPDVEKVKKLFDDMPVRCIGKKYEHKNINSQNEMEMLFFVDHIIRMNRVSKLEDIEQLCSTFPNLLYQARLNIITDYIENEKYIEAVKLIDSYPLQTLEFCEDILIKINVRLKSRHPSIRKLLKNYMELIDVFKSRIVKLKTGFHCTELIIEELKYMYKFENYQPENRAKCICSLTVDLISSLTGEEESSEEICRKVGHLHNALGAKQEEGWLELMQSTSDFNLLSTATNFIYENSESSHYLASASAIMLSHVGLKPDVPATDLNLTILPDAKNINVLDTKMDETPSVEALRLVESAVYKALCNIRGDGTTACWHLADWIDCCYTITSRTKDPTRTPSPDCITMFHKVWTVYQNIVQKMDPEPHLKYIVPRQSTQMSQEQLREIISSLWTQTNELGTSFENLVTAQNLIMCLVKSLTNLKKSKKLSPSLVQTLNGLIMNLDKRLLYMIATGKRQLNIHLALVFLRRLEPTDAQKCLQAYLNYAYLNDANKFLELSKLAIAFESSASLSSKHLVNLKNWKWWTRMDTCGIAYREFFKSPPQVLLNKLLPRQEMTLEHLQEFCMDYQLNLAIHLGGLLRIKLLQWRPEYDVNKELNGRRVMLKENTQLYDECLSIVRLMDSKQAILVLRKMWDHVSFYLYEVYRCIYDLLIWVNAEAAKDFYNHNLILIFLEQYERESVPSEREQELWFTAFPNMTLDPLSEWRLPNIFWAREGANSLGNCLEIVKSEITLFNYTQWFVIAHLLDLKVNDICIYAIKSTISKSKLKYKEGKWNIQLKHPALLNSINECVQHITNSEDATAVLNAVLNYTSGGADLVEITKLCYEYAKKWKEMGQDSNLKNAYLKIQKKYHHNSTMHVLHLYHLTDEIHLRFVGDADRLIESLYNDKRILEKDQLKCPDINNAVNDIAAIYEINMEQKRYQLLNHWMSVYSSANNSQCIAESNFKKIVYLCKCSEKLTLVNYLVTISMRPLDETAGDTLSSIINLDVNYYTRYHALRCLNVILDNNELEEFTGKSSVELRNLMEKWLIISDLVSILGLALTPEKLDEYNKSALIQSLTRISNKPQVAVKLLSNLCRHYKLNKMNYWEFIIGRMTVLNMGDDLFKDLIYLDENCNMFSNKWYINGWEKVIELWLSNMNDSDTEKFQDMCIKTLENIKMCPIFSKLNVRNICKLYIDNGKPEFAVILLHYLPSTCSKKDIIEDILKNQKELILDKLRLLSFNLPDVNFIIDNLQKC